ncbi:MAG: hypothetical protein IT455_08555 [Planctomycetes bacterium]|nr:hypothetical protein [Planctomycetota bacterium]
MMSTTSRWRTLLLGGLLIAATAAQEPAPAPAPAVAREVHGKVVDRGGLKVVHVWGSPAERGYAHGFLLAEAVTEVAIREFAARFADRQPLLQQARSLRKRLIEYPADVQAELEALYQALLDKGVDLTLPGFGRDFDLDDLLVANALDVFGLMGCSGFTAWGDEVQGGGVLTARNFDWPFTGDHMLQHTVVLVEHLPSGRAVASVTWPGFVGTVTGVSDDGVAAFLHVGSAKITLLPEPSSWPTATAARAILERGAAGEPAAVFQKAQELLGNTSPPAGFLTRIVLPQVPADGAPEVAFETDAAKSVFARAATGPCVVTNHFRSRDDGRKASRDSLDRETKLSKGLGGLLGDGDHSIDISEAWQVLRSVQRGGGHGFGTLHALVFRFAPWHFELRLAQHPEPGLIAAPVSELRYVLSKDELFQIPE